MSDEPTAVPTRIRAHYSNDIAASGPDYSLDYLFHSPKLQRPGAGVLPQAPNPQTSDQLPVSARLKLSAQP